MAEINQAVLQYARDVAAAGKRYFEMREAADTDGYGPGYSIERELLRIYSAAPFRVKTVEELRTSIGEDREIDFDFLSDPLEGVRGETST